MKERLDILIVNKGLAASREKAKAIIMSGIVYVDGQKEDKAGSMFEETANIEVRGATLKYVSRGGLKLEKAMTHFGVQLKDKICMDVGSSTGGFTDCMLQNGAVKVYAVDVGHGSSPLSSILWYGRFFLSSQPAFFNCSSKDFSSTRIPILEISRAQLSCSYQNRISPFNCQSS